MDTSGKLYVNVVTNLLQQNWVQLRKKYSELAPINVPENILYTKVLFISQLEH
jgi:hypothetical protein